MNKYFVKRIPSLYGLQGCKIYKTKIDIYDYERRHYNLKACGYYRVTEETYNKVNGVEVTPEQVLIGVES